MTEKHTPTLQDIALLKQLLTAHSYEVLESPEGLQALDLARDEQPNLILMDIRLPDISGVEVSRLLKQDDQTKTIPIIAITALASPEDEKKGVEGGCDAYTPKPINLGNLLRTIESLYEYPARDADDRRINQLFQAPFLVGPDLDQAYPRSFQPFSPLGDVDDHAIPFTEAR